MLRIRYRRRSRRHAERCELDIICSAIHRRRSIRARRDRRQGYVNGAHPLQDYPNLAAMSVARLTVRLFERRGLKPRRWKTIFELRVAQYMARTRRAARLRTEE